MKKQNKVITSPYNTVQKNSGTWHNRILIFTPHTGLVRTEWVQARYGQIIPTNWSNVELIQFLSSYSPLEYLLPDAENLAAKAVVEGDFEWLLSYENDNLPPPDAFIRVNEYMQSKEAPVVSGLYFTKSVPPEPILYKGRGSGAFHDFKLGEKVWVDGVPFGFTLIHGSIIKAMWDESPEYVVDGQKTRRVFDLPDRNMGSIAEGGFEFVRGTTDLNWCSRIMKEDFFTKAGWPEFQKKKFPFLVDTNILVGHIDQQGRNYPLGGVPQRYK